ncbi:hypothetical protein SARC_17428, partial [Sphaeroforma arctica JP610]
VISCTARHDSILPINLMVKLYDDNFSEKQDSVTTGKYTIGLGQDHMAYCTDLEDIHSIALTVTSRLMRRAVIGYNKIGRLE